MWDSMEWIKAMVGSRKRRRRRKRLAFKDILSTSRTKKVSLPTMATISRKVATKRKSTRNNPRSREESDQVSCH